MLTRLFVCALVTAAVCCLSSLSPLVLGVPSPSAAKALYCAVCEVAVDEIHSGIARTESKHAVQTRWRIDEKKRIPYERTEHRLLEIIEQEIPSRLHLYGATNHTGRVMLVTREQHTRSTQSDGHADTSTSASGTTADPDEAAAPRDADSGDSAAAAAAASVFTHDLSLRTKVTTLYEKLVDLHLEDLLLAFHTDRQDDDAQLKESLCVRTVKACKKGTMFQQPIAPVASATSTPVQSNKLQPPHSPSEPDSASARSEL